MVGRPNQAREPLKPITRQATTINQLTTKGSLTMVSQVTRATHQDTNQGTQDRLSLPLPAITLIPIVVQITKMMVTSLKALVMSPRAITQLKNHQ